MKINAINTNIHRQNFSNLVVHSRNKGTIEFSQDDIVNIKNRGNKDVEIWVRNGRDIYQTFRLNNLQSTLQLLDIAKKYPQATIHLGNVD